MKRFLKFYQKDKQYVKMINQTEKGFDLVILSDAELKQILETINDSEEKNDDLSVVWEMKFKKGNFIHYLDCKFSEPIDNNFYKIGRRELQPCGKKIKITCSGVVFYSSWYFKMFLSCYISSTCHRFIYINFNNLTEI